MTHWLRDLSHDEIFALMKGDGSKFARCYVDVTLGRYDYRLECMMRKCLKIWRWPKGAEKYVEKTKRDGTSYWKLSECDRATVWDAWGFFQGSFVSALNEWLPDHPDTPLIIEMKQRRGDFSRSEMDMIRLYNRKEVALLVLMMERVRDAIRALGLKVTRWDGAGAIAAAMFKHHRVKEHMGESPPEVFEASRYAYSGGHIEMFTPGSYRKTVFHYDINSAYPHQFRNLPGLQNGFWKRSETSDPLAGFTLVELSYSFVPGLPFYPLFYRQGNGSIIYPRQGKGWYWFSEFVIARRFAERYGADEFTVHQWWHWENHSNVRPFAWIEGYYNQRRDLIKAARANKQPAPGETKTLKLGYNACYGKTAQQVGARFQDGELQLPGFFQLEWSGYVTAGCRAQIMEAAMQKPHAIIAVATDGIFSTEQLDLPCNPSKELGEWEFQQHEGMTIVMPGVYWLHDTKGDTHHSRGFDKADLRDVALIQKAWKRKQRIYKVKVTRLITLGSALTSDTFWKMRGCWAESHRELKINGDNSKRHPFPVTTSKPHMQLVTTHPREVQFGFIEQEDLMSAPYSLPWLEDGEPAAWDWEDHEIEAIEF